jgi:hypothetical protein
MIDKLDLRIPKNAISDRTITPVFSWDPTRGRNPSVQRALHYEARADLRSLGIDAFLHFRCKHGDHHSKLEILDAGTKHYGEMISIIERLTTADPSELGIMRIDLAADIPNVTVPWFKSHVRFKYKRSEKEHGKNIYGLISRGEIETITAGSGSNMFRIYNKIAEYQSQLRNMRRTANQDADVLELEKEFGVKEKNILTRIERQCRGKGIPPEILTFSSLGSLPQLNPFSRVEIVRSKELELPRPEQCNGMEYYTGLGLHLESQRIGMQGLRKQLNKLSNGNAARTLTSYERFFPGGSLAITMEDILNAFRESTREQLAS